MAKKKKTKKRILVNKPIREKQKTKKLPTRRKSLIDEKKIAIDLAQAVHEKFDRMIKASVLFGSQARGETKPGSDIDIIFVIDDAAIEWDLELISWYREELGKIISVKAKKYDRNFHINTVKLTTWWQDLINGDPVIINILRFGEALIDSGGFFNPMKALLLQGKLHSTPEAAYSALQRAPGHLARSRASELGAIEGVYWCMVDSAQAALITAGKMPPSPEHLAQMLKETFVDAGILKMNYVSAIRDLYAIHKSISHGELFNIKGIEIDRWQDIAEQFLNEMSRIIDRLIDHKKKASS